MRLIAPIRSYFSLMACAFQPILIVDAAEFLFHSKLIFAELQVCLLYDRRGNSIVGLRSRWGDLTFAHMARCVLQDQRVCPISAEIPYTGASGMRNSIRYCN